MGPARTLSGYGRVYVWGVVTLGVCVIGVSVLEANIHPLPWQWFLLSRSHSREWLGHCQAALNLQHRSQFLKHSFSRRFSYMEPLRERS